MGRLLWTGALLSTLIGNQSGFEGNRKASVGASEVVAVSPLQGTFIQLTGGQRWTTARLTELFRDFESLGLSRIVVQWTVMGTKAFYPSRAFDSVSDPPLESILRLADASGIKVRIGLLEDPEFWTRIGPAEPVEAVTAYLKRLRSGSFTAARELAPLIAGHRSFDGWFMSEEIDDVNWLSRDRRVLLRAHVADLSQALSSLGPSRSVAISGFSNAHCDPATLEAFWAGLLDSTHIDLLFFQDGIGAHKLELPYAAQYFGAMKRAAVAHGRGLSVVVELFEQVAGPPVNSGPFKAVPTRIDRLTQQLTLAGDASTAGITAFSVPDYMARGLGPAEFQLFSDYARIVAPKR